jgi:hypothetical protein
MKSSEELDKLATAFAGAQADLKPIKKDADNPFFSSSYASLESVIELCRPVLAKHGLTIMQDNGHDPDLVVVTTRMLHTSGQWIESETALKPIPAKIDRSSNEKAVTPQATGSAISYARRYGYMAIVGLSTTDDDGAAASANDKGAVTAQEDLGTFEDTITDVRMRKNGHTNVYTVETGGGHKLQTLSIELATAAKSLKGTDETVILDSSPTKYGPQLNSIARKE